MYNREYNKSSQKGLFKQLKSTDKILLLIAAWFGAGFIPFAPGTWGSLATLPFAAGAYSLGIIPSVLSFVFIIILSIPISGAASKILKREDPSEVVIDEAAGIFVTMFLIPVSWSGIIAGFILFRFFDILKPFPIRLIDRRIKGGAGIVLDDIMAGVYGNVCLRIILFLVDK